jgi:actin related protein 2/3 complex subunit 3
MKKIVAPNEAGWSLGGMFPTPANSSEADTWRLYMKQGREEVGLRVLEVLYYPDGSKNKWWQCFSKRKFMGKELK